MLFRSEKKPVAAADREDEKMETVIAASALNQQNPLQQTEACLYREDCREFYELLNKEMKIYLSQKFSIYVSDINAKKITQVMDRLNMDNNIVLQLQQLMQEIEWQVYTPFEQSEKRAEMYSRSHGLIQLINSYSAVNL